MSEVFTFPDCGCEIEKVGEENGMPKLRWSPELENIPLDCSRTWDLISSGNTKGVFQLESRLGSMVAKRLKPRNIEHLSALIAIIRPGCLNVSFDKKTVTQHYIDRKNGKENVEYFHPALKNALKDTYGLLIYQEGAMQIAKDIAGFDPQQADVLRKCICEGSWVYTQSGPRKIEDIFGNNKLQPQILTTKNNKLQYLPIKRVWKSGKQDIYEIITEKGYKIKVTEHHQIFTQNGWQELKDIKKDDFVIVPNNYTYKGSSTISLDQAIILSYVISEGTHSKDTTKITNSDTWILDKIRQSLKNLNAETKEYSFKNGCVDIHIKGRVRDWIRKQLPFAKSRNKIIPKSIYTATNGITSAFVGHYFSAEGTINNLQNLDISSTSLEIIEVLQILLLRDGIHSNISSKSGTYKEKPYISYRLYIFEEDIYKFKNKYKNYICPKKLTKIEQIKNPNYSNSKWLVPSCFIRSATFNQNINAIFGIPIGGNVYNKNLTYDSAYRLNQYINSELLTNILEADYKFTKIKSITYIGQKETYDFEINDKNNHFGFINGILVHNSIGKKQADLMAKVQTEFLDGCKQQKIVNEKEAIEIFSGIRASQRYAFNKSHSVSYALNAYLSAYVKAHFPRMFFTSYLYFAQEKSNPHEEINELVNNAKLNNIDVVCPSLKYMNEHFRLLDGKIHFGFADIKGIGAAVLTKVGTRIETIEQLIKKKVAEWTWIDFLAFAVSHINKTAWTGIVSSGALDFLKEHRARMLYEGDLYSTLSKKEKEWVMKYCLMFPETKSFKEILEAMCEAPVGRNGACANKNRKVKIEEMLELIRTPPRSLIDSPVWIAYKEEELLGISLSCSIVDGCTKNDANCDCKQFINGYNSKPIVLGVKLDTINEIRTKKGKNPGQRMAFITASDSSAQLDGIVVFPDVWKENRHLFIEGNTVLLVGNRGKEKTSLIVEKVLQI